VNSIGMPLWMFVVHDPDDAQAEYYSDWESDDAEAEEDHVSASSRIPRPTEQEAEFNLQYDDVESS
jgi:hypothetical protein